jgi:L-amino acid N-acyltransferase YncA
MSGPAADGISIRDATPADAAGIAAVYNGGIEDRIATFETALRSPGERAEWLAARGPRHPVIVAIGSSGALLGWASLNSFSPRAAYDLVADISVYIAREARGRGIGTALMDALEDRARAEGYHKLVLGVFPHNAVAVALYGSRGFTTVGTYREQGLLDGRRLDVTLMEKILGDGPAGEGETRG